MIPEIHTALVILVLTVPFFAGTMWAIVNATQKEFASMGQKALWIIIAAVPFVGFVVYFLFGSRRGRKTS